VFALFLESDLSFSVLSRSTFPGSHLLFATAAKALLILLLAFWLRTVKLVVPYNIVSHHLIQSVENPRLTGSRKAARTTTI
jgi:hypothetical protein